MISGCARVAPSRVQPVYGTALADAVLIPWRDTWRELAQALTATWLGGRRRSGSPQAVTSLPRS
jgi:hypothetical protein